LGIISDATTCTILSAILEPQTNPAKDTPWWTNKGEKFIPPTKRYLIIANKGQFLARYIALHIGEMNTKMRLYEIKVFSECT